jgi:putative membrane protein
MKILVNWVLSAVSIMIVSHLVGGFDVTNFTAALFAAIVIGFVNATIGFVLKIVTLPLTFLTFGVFWFVINAVMLILASWFVPGFSIHGFMPAFLGAIVLSVVNLFMKAIGKSVTEPRR